MAISVLVVSQLVAPSGVGEALSLSDLDRAHHLVMSCGDSEGPSNEPMWCADPSSPQCVPAAPHNPAPDLSNHSAPALLLSGTRLVMSYVTVAWPAPLQQTLLSLADRARLERPPRA